MKQSLFQAFILCLCLFLVNACGNRCNCEQVPASFQVLRMETDGVVFGWDATSPPNLFSIVITNVATDAAQTYPFSNGAGDPSEHKVKFADFSDFVKVGELYKATIKKDCSGKKFCAKNDFSTLSEEVYFIRKAPDVTPPFTCEVEANTTPCDSLQLSWTPFAAAVSYRINILNSSGGAVSTLFQDVVGLNPTQYGKVLSQGTNTIWVDALDNNQNVVASTNTLVVCCVIVIEDIIDNFRTKCGISQEVLQNVTTTTSAGNNTISNTFVLPSSWGSATIRTGFSPNPNTPNKVKIFACPKQVAGLYYTNVSVHYTRPTSELLTGNYTMYVFRLNSVKANCDCSP